MRNRNQRMDNQKWLTKRKKTRTNPFGAASAFTVPCKFFKTTSDTFKYFLRQEQKEKIIVHIKSYSTIIITKELAKTKIK